MYDWYPPPMSTIMEEIDDPEKVEKNIAVENTKLRKKKKGRLWMVY